MLSGGVASDSDSTDLRSSRDALPAAHTDRTQMGISGLPAIAVIQYDQVAKTVFTPAGKNHNAAIG